MFFNERERRGCRGKPTRRCRRQGVCVAKHQDAVECRSHRCQWENCRGQPDRRRGGRWLGLLIVWVASAGCYQRMADQPRYDPLERSDFFADTMASRPLVAGVVPRGQQPHSWTRLSSHFVTGVVDGEPARTFPRELRDRWSDEQVLERGRERYAVFCSHCHDLTGSGLGTVPRRGYPTPPTFHSQRLRAAPVGQLFQVISDGVGRMPPHASQIPPADRWAIAAYVVALQRSKSMPVDELEATDREMLEGDERMRDR